MKTDERLIWLNGAIVPLSDAKINVLAPTSQFGANVFEGIRGYVDAKQKQLYIFRLNEHLIRLKNSIKMFRIEDKYTFEDLKESLISVIKANKFMQDIAIRQTVFVDGFGTWTASGPAGMFIAPIAKPRINLENTTGIKCCISSWERISDKNLSPKVKVGANYINSRMAQMEAIQNGYDSAIFLNSQGKVSEGPGSCFFMIRGNELITPPCTASVLESITRETIITLAKEQLNLKVLERDIDRTELYICDEAFLCGSAVEVLPIQSVDGLSVNNQKFTYTKLIHSLYLKTVSGENSKHTDWLTPVY